MHDLTKIFPPTDFTLLAVILLLPLLGALVNGVFGKRLGKEGVTLMALAAVGGSFLAAVVTFVMLLSAQHDLAAKGGEEAARFMWRGWEWLKLSNRFDTAQIPIDVAFSIDALSSTMSLVVTGVGFLIHLYSTKYMGKDDGYHRYFAYLNLFIFSMLVLILGNNLPILFVGWEGVGLCSYLLIGFWFDEEKNVIAGKKAFITNRIGDFGLLVAMALILYYIGSLDWSGIEGGRMNLVTRVQLWPIGNHFPGSELIVQKIPSFKGAMDWLNTPHYASAATLVGLALFLGCAGKSAQIPLYVWLPDAMAGPTPVSALIHAATMVTAGVYLVCRMAAVFVLSPAAMFVVAFIGALTAVFAATIALVQTDIKKVLAYSTVSQLGYMFLGVGVGAFTAGFFHVVTHAFFKACLFLGAGSVIFALHKRIHDTDASQDMRNMGGLKKYMPYTFWTFAAAWVAIIGVPLTAGFFSKDEILLRAYTTAPAFPIPDGKLIDPRSGQTVLEMFAWPSWAGTALYSLGVLGAILTAFYMSRLVFGIFWGDFHGWKIKKGWKEPKYDEHADEHHGEHDELLEGPRPQESPWQMTVPLVVLGFLAIVGGFLSAHTPLFQVAPLEHFLDPVFAFANGKEALAAGTHGPGVTELAGAHALEWPLLLFGIGAVVVGAGAAWWVYLKQDGALEKSFAERMPGLYELMVDKWRIDELYEETVIGAVDSLGEFFVVFDKYVVDGILAGLSSVVVAAVGTGLRLVQTGRVQAYAAVMVVGVGGLGWFMTAPHAEVKTDGDAKSGSYTLNAAPGLGYGYRWDADGDGKPDHEEFGAEEKVTINVDRGKTRKVTLEVKNAFGRVAHKEIVVSRAKADLDSAPGGAFSVQQGDDGKLHVMPGQGRPPAQPMPGAMPGQPGRMPRLPFGLPGAPGRAPGPGQMGAPGAPGRMPPVRPPAPGGPQAPPGGAR
jgi:NADH-quinone oxidoreductase subunit L